MRHRILTRHPVGALADHDDQFHFVIRAPIRTTNRHALTRPNQRAGGFQEQTRGVNVEGASRIVPVKGRIRGRFDAVFLVVHRGRDDLAWIRDGAEQRDRLGRHRSCMRHQGPGTI